MDTQLRDLGWINGRMVLFTDDNTNQEKAVIAKAMVSTFQEAYALALTGRTVDQVEEVSA